MKKICSLVGMMWLAGIVQAQGDYVPFPKSNAEWRVAAYNGLKYSEMYGGSLYHPHNTFGYRMIEYDTLIEGVQYPSIMLIYVPPGEDEYGYKLGYCAFREENKKVYVYMPECGEQLLYDFSLKIGDTIFYSVGALRSLNTGFGYKIDEENPHYKVLVYIDTVELNTGEKRRRWHLSGSGGRWIEGIGDYNGIGLFEPFVNDVTWGGDSFEFTCFNQNQQTIYLSPACNNCSCWQFPNNIVNIASLDISIYPNPTYSQLRITNYELRIKQVELYGMVGNLIQSVQVDDKELEIDMQNLQSGIYFVKVITEEGIIVKKIVKL